MGKPGSNSDSTSKADKKFAKKLQFYAKVRDTVATLSATKAISKKSNRKSRQQKSKVYDLSSLSEFLPDVGPLYTRERPATGKDFKLNSKSRGKLILKEAEHLKAVLCHPAFQADPFGALHQHLESTQPILKDKGKVKKDDKGGKKKDKKKKKSSKSSKPSSTTAAMED
ncbi:hypothetical protein MLD38_015428 [Melastoma candidum]|uniref:Uncharacterized protein n=1 Tax=Melastoma candidum TaxID=119954 RepID=A0ACB9RI01_9MYRT|nr:hypothetical protein MLD38_015428 [Melastoma candidum]